MARVPILPLDRDVRHRRVGVGAGAVQTKMHEQTGAHSCWFILGHGPAVVVAHGWGVVFSAMVSQFCS